jgi:hypothetical protein
MDVFAICVMWTRHGYHIGLTSVIHQHDMHPTGRDMTTTVTPLATPTRTAPLSAGCQLDIDMKATGLPCRALSTRHGVRVMGTDRRHDADGRRTENTCTRGKFNEHNKQKSKEHNVNNCNNNMSNRAKCRVQDLYVCRPRSCTTHDA